MHPSCWAHTSQLALPSVFPSAGLLTWHSLPTPPLIQSCSSFKAHVEPHPLQEAFLPFQPIPLCQGSSTVLASVHAHMCVCVYECVRESQSCVMCVQAHDFPCSAPLSKKRARQSQPSGVVVRFKEGVSVGLPWWLRR